MRNLKRALSLALAAVMVIGMMVTGAGAATLNEFPDKADIVNQDAVSLLTTLKVIDGMGDGSGKFNPTGNVTRAMMAKMIAVALSGGADNSALYANMTSKLTDISTSWAKGFINFCFSQGIIAGRGDNKFDPDANVTAAEAAKMLLAAAGYKAEIEGFVGPNWSTNVSAKASALGIFKNFTKDITAPLSRDDAALLIFNALDVEMIQKYESGYALVFEDGRTILSTTYGVYKITGVVVSNEYAALMDTDSDFASAAGKTTMDNIKVYKSTTSNTVKAEYEALKGTTVFNTVTTADMLGKTVTMYAQKTTVLANSKILGVYLREGDNNVKTYADNQDTMKDALSGTGLVFQAVAGVDAPATQVYVNFGKEATVASAQKSMKFSETTGRFSSVTNSVNAYGVVMDIIDNNGDGVIDYVLYQQETLTQVVATNTNKETTTLNDFNNNKAIDNVDIVTEKPLAEGDLALAVSFGGRFYVAAPEIITGKMDSFSSSKTKQQYIEVSGEKYYPSFIKYAADSVSNTYEFDIVKCGKTDAVNFNITYDFIRDTNGNIIAYRPSEKGLYNFALILDSGYDAGRTNSNPTGEVKVLLPDGTQGNYALDFDASAQNIGDQLYTTAGTAADRKHNGIVELKGFLGTSGSDNTSTAPIAATAMKAGIATGATAHFTNKTGTLVGTKSGHAEGYVVGYSLDADSKILTITSIVGHKDLPTGAVAETHYNPTAAENPKSIEGTLSKDYDTGAARIEYNAGANKLTIDQNTVAFYYTTDTKGDIVYGVAVGYSKMSDVSAAADEHNDFVAATLKNTAAPNTNLATTILFNAEGVVSEKNYAYVIGSSKSDTTGAVLDVVLMDGTASTLKISRSDFDSIFDTDAKFGTVYSYTAADGKGLSKLTAGVGDDGTAKYGYVVKLRDGTVALYEVNADKTVGKYIDAYSYDKNIWNVQDIKTTAAAPSGGFAESVYKETILVLDGKLNTVRTAYIKSVLSGQTPSGPDFGWDLTNFKDVYPTNTAAEILKIMTEGYNIRMNGDYTLNATTGNLYIPAGRIFYATGNLTETAGYRVETGGTLWVKGNYAASGNVTVDTQVGGNLLLPAASTISAASVKVGGNITGTTLTVAKGSNVYATGDVTVATLNVAGHIESNNYTMVNGTVTSKNTLIARGTLNATGTLTIGDATNAGAVTVTGKLNAGTVILTNGTLTLNNAAKDDTIATLNTNAGTTLNVKGLTVTGGTVSGAVNVSDTLTVTALTVGATGVLTTAKTTGTVTVTAGGIYNTTDKTGTADVGGALSGTFGGNVTLKTAASVDAGKTLTVNGKLDNGAIAIGVTGTLVLNGEVAAIDSKITGTAAGAKVTFGANAITKGLTNSTTFYYAGGTAVPAEKLPGMSFTYVAGTVNKFVSATQTATEDVTFKIGETEVSNQTAKTVTVTLATDSKATTITATKLATQTIASSDSTVVVTENSSDKTKATIAIASLTNGVVKKFNLTVTEKDTTSITYAVTVTVGATPSIPDGAMDPDSSIVDINAALTKGDVNIVGNVDFTAFGETTVLEIPAGKTLTITGNLIGNKAIVNRGTLTVGGDFAPVAAQILYTGTYNVAGTLTALAAYTVSGNVTVGTLAGDFAATVTGSLTVKTTNSNAAAITSSGTLKLPTVGAGLLTVTGGTTTVTGAVGAGGLTVSGGDVTIAGAVGGGITATGGTVTAKAVTGAVTASGAAGVTVTTVGTTVGVTDTATVTASTVAGKVTTADGTTLTLTGDNTFAASSALGGTVTVATGKTLATPALTVTGTLTVDKLTASASISGTGKLVVGTFTNAATGAAFANTKTVQVTGAATAATLEAIAAADGSTLIIDVASSDNASASAVGDAKFFTTAGTSSAAGTFVSDSSKIPTGTYTCAANNVYTNANGAQATAWLLGAK